MGFRGCACPTYNRENLLRGEALLGLFGAKVELQKDIRHFVIGHAPGVNGLKEMEGIYGLHKLYIRENQLKFIGLEMADKMPADIGGHLRNLCGKFLRAAFGKDALPGVVGLHEAVYGVIFGDGNKLYPGGQGFLD